jgi:phage terminase small subunit
VRNVTVQPKHHRFVEEYAKDGNATAAYRRAGYRARGHSAEINASRLRKRPDVTAACRAVFDAAQAAAARVLAKRQVAPTRVLDRVLARDIHFRAISARCQRRIVSGVTSVATSRIQARPRRCPSTADVAIFGHYGIQLGARVSF